MKKKNPNSTDTAVVTTVLVAAGYLLAQLMTTPVAQSAAQLAQQCCGR